jgi:hypothetical protein
MGAPCRRKGWMALRRLGWGAGIPEAGYVSDRGGGPPKRPPPVRFGRQSTVARS